ncbi:MAG TPA: hypothetical protein VII91_00385 [Bauldia sp.]
MTSSGLIARQLLLLFILTLRPAFAGAQEPAPPQQVDGPTISSLIRATIVALHQANVTGNYTVLRDLGSTIMQASNNAADLARHFASFRENHVSLSAAILLDATLDQKPMLSTDGQLRLVGHFVTTPREIVFDMTFLYQNGAWRITLLNVGTRQGGTDSGASPTAPPAKPASAAPVPQVPPPKPKPKP